MRNFEERKAEIFLRSEKKINERKKNVKYILSACVCVMFMACISFLHTDGSIIMYDNSLKHIYISVDVLKNDTNHTTTITDASDVTDIYETISYSFKQNENYKVTKSSLESNVNQNSENNQDIENSLYHQQGYTITINAENEKHTYILNNHRLYDMKSEVFIKLNNKQLNNLKQILDIEDK